MGETFSSTTTNGLSNQVNVLIISSAAVNILLAIILSLFGHEMYPFFIILYIWIAVYVFFIATLIRRDSISERPLIQKKSHLVWIIALLVLIRLIFIRMTQYISLDALWYGDFGKFMQMGAIPYYGFYFPYPPVFAYFIYIITSITPGVEGFRLFAIMMDVGVLIVLWKLVYSEVGPKWASTAAITYTFLPISIIESGWNGHFEPLVSLFLLLALWFLLKKRYSMSGVFLGLAIATKIYPLVVLPILFAYIKGWNERIRFTVSTIVTSALTFVPILIVTVINYSSETVFSSISNSIGGFIDSLSGFLFTLPFPAYLFTIVFVIGTVIGVIHLMRLIARNDPDMNVKLYHSVTITLGLILIAMGVVAALYPLMPISTQVFWRFPIDIGIVRGVTTICIGLLIIFTTRRDWVRGLKKQVSLNLLLTLIGATALLLVAMARLFFYGWYLLWSIPFFLLLRDRRLSYTVILCLLLVYPNYTTDNFASLGFGETRQWQDEFNAVDGWITQVNIKGSGVNSSQVSASVDTDGANGQFWFDTRNITNTAYLSQVSFSYIKDVEFSFERTTEFVVRIISSWDPSFGRYADLSFSFEGIDTNNNSIHGSIIPKTSDFTNLTYTVWSYSFTNLDISSRNGTITNLNMTIYPVQQVRSSYRIDYMYTTNEVLFNPVYFLIIPSLIAIALAAFTILYTQLEREHNRHYSGGEVEDPSSAVMGMY